MVLGVQMLRNCPDQTKSEAARQAYIAAGEASFANSQSTKATVKASPQTLEEKAKAAAAKREIAYSRISGRD